MPSSLAKPKAASQDVESKAVEDPSTAQPPAAAEKPSGENNVSPSSWSLHSKLEKSNNSLLERIGKKPEAPVENTAPASAAPTTIFTARPVQLIP